MDSLAFFYHGFNIFISRETNIIEGSNNILQVWFLKHTRPQASHLKANEGHLMVEYYQRKLQELDKIKWLGITLIGR